MAKWMCFLALFVVVVVCAEAIRIDPARPSDRRLRYISNLKEDDPRCKEKDGMFADPNDCTKYLKCVNGNGQEMKCPDGFKFDTRRHCVLPHEGPDCGNPNYAPPGVDIEDLKCPRSDGKFPYKPDCHKYILCKDRVPELKTCPEKQFFSFVNYNCISSKKCPQPRSNSEVDIVCKKKDEFIAIKGECRKYYECKNPHTKPIPKTCPPGKAVDVKRKTCTVEKRRSCKSNDIRHVDPDE